MSKSINLNHFCQYFVNILNIKSNNCASIHCIDCRSHSIKCQSNDAIITDFTYFKINIIHFNN